jgi:cytochrome c
MKRFPAQLVCAVGLLAASFLLAELHPFGKPDLSVRAASARPAVDVSPQVSAILSAKCADCHSGLARMPLYGHLAPASWLIERDMVRARAAMDLSRWDTYSPEEQETLRSKIAQEAKTKSMPPPQYLAMHWTARLNQREIRILTAWAATHPVATGSETAMSGDATRGRLIFEKRCTGCHALTQDREGPRLRGVYGRSAGTVPHFDYSDALRNAHVVWDYASLDRWLTDPQAFLPGNNMEFHVARLQERADLIRYLREQSGR